MGIRVSLERVLVALSILTGAFFLIFLGVVLSNPDLPQREAVIPLLTLPILLLVYPMKVLIDSIRVSEAMPILTLMLICVVVFGDALTALSIVSGEAVLILPFLVLNAVASFIFLGVVYLILFSYRVLRDWRFRSSQPPLEALGEGGAKGDDLLQLRERLYREGFTVEENVPFSDYIADVFAFKEDKSTFISHHTLLFCFVRRAARVEEEYLQKYTQATLDYAVNYMDADQDISCLVLPVLVSNNFDGGVLASANLRRGGFTSLLGGYDSFELTRKVQAFAHPVLVFPDKGQIIHYVSSRRIFGYKYHGILAKAATKLFSFQRPQIVKPKVNS